MAGDWILMGLWGTSSYRNSKLLELWTNPTSEMLFLSLLGR